MTTLHVSEETRRLRNNTRPERRREALEWPGRLALPVAELLRAREELLRAARREGVGV